MDATQLAQCIADLGRRLGIEELCLDADGVCTLAIDDGRWIVAIGHHPDEDGLRLMLCIDELLPTPAQLARLMSAHFAWGAGPGLSFALAPRSGALVLQRQLGGEQLAAGQLADAIAALVDAAETWVAQLATPDQSADAPVDAGFLGARA